MIVIAENRKCTETMFYISGALKSVAENRKCTETMIYTSGVLKRVAENRKCTETMFYTNGALKSAVQNDLQLDVNNVTKWFKDNRIRVNVHKCDSM